MPPQDEPLVPAAEFQALPLAFIVAAPLKAAVDAQTVAAQTTRNFINSLMTGDEKAKKPISVEFSTTLNNAITIQPATETAKSVTGGK